MNLKNISRRKFLGQASCGAISSTTLLSTLLNLKALNAAAISDSAVIGAGDYKALVCISLSGGSDSFNMLVPRTNSEYLKYQAIRSNLALDHNSLLSLQASNTGSRSFGLHPSMPGIQQLFNEGKLAMMANMGTLVEPATREEIWDRTKKAPLGLLSHNDQLQQWQTGITHERSSIGWGGRVADMIKDMNSNTEISMNISLDKNNVFQTGSDTIPYTVNPSFGASTIWGYNAEYMLNEQRTKAIDNLLEQNYTDIYEKTYIKTLKNAHLTSGVFNEGISGIELNTDFSSYNDSGADTITPQMNMVAKIIAARETLGFKRQTFFVDFGGWDHHDEALNNQSTMLAMLDNAVTKFQNAMVELGTEGCVVSFVISDFARTLSSNGNGTDHGWGGNVFAVGGPVIGQNIYGTYPESLDPDENPLEMSGGVMLPTTSVDLYLAELAHWFGVSKSNLEGIFPNLRNFYQYESTSANPMGFLRM